ncbi:MAG: tetratricopeptide repeat protein [Muribaculaceae bacterium]|nr:tetratricopeptide repeat protein [Muribaculaceae bacterium]
MFSTVGCKKHTQKDNAPLTESANDTVSPLTRAFNMVRDGRPFEEYMPVQMEAVAQLRSGHPQDDAILILSQTGHFLMRHGDYIEALEYLQEASDSARVRVQEGRVEAGTIQLHGNLGSVIARYGLMDEALAENARAIEVSALNGYAHMVDLWRMRSAIYSLFINGAENKQELCDSMLYCINMAYSFVPKMRPDVQELHLDKCNLEKAGLFVEFPDLYPDSLGTAIKLLEQHEAGRFSGSSAKMMLGRAYVLAGRHNEGLDLMERGLQEYRAQNWKEGVEWGLQLLAMSYAQAGRGDKLAALYPEVDATEDDLMNRAKLNTLIGADFKYRLRDKQHQVDTLREENAISQKIILLGGVVLLLGLIAGAFLAFIYIKLKSKSRKERESHQMEISDILSKQVMLNNQIEMLNEQLEKKENDAVIDRVTEQINPAMLNGEDGTNFRRAFMSLHPHVLKKLRRDYPALTQGDELLCMLIYLKVPSIDMAASLGISRASLNSARYRLRRRLNLDKDTDLDGFIQNQ